MRSDNGVDLDVLTLGRVDNTDFSRGLAGLRQVGVPAAAALIRRHKVQTLVASRLANISDDSAKALLVELSATVEVVRRRQTLAPHMEEVLTSIAEREGLRVVAFKGLAASRWYDDPHTRDITDIDVYVPTFGEADALARAVRDLGHIHNPNEYPWIKGNADDVALFGQINLIPSDRDRYVGMDIHFGAYSVRHCARFRLSVPDRAGLTYATDVENICAVVNNGAGDHFVTMKDVNDLVLTSRRDPQLVPQVTRWADGVGLSGFLRHVSALAEATGGAAGTRVNRQTVVTRLAEPRPPVDSPSWGARCRATTAHAFAIGWRSSPVDAWRLSRSAYRYYRHRLQLNVTSDPKALTRLTKLTPSTCWRLVPVTAFPQPTAVQASEPPAAPRALADGIDVLPTPDGDIVRIGGECYVPTVDYRVYDKQLERAWALSAAAAPSGP